MVANFTADKVADTNLIFRNREISTAECRTRNHHVQCGMYCHNGVHSRP